MAKKDTRIIHDRLYEKVSSSLRRREREFSSFARRFFDENSESLFATHPGGRVIYKQKKEEKIFEMCGVTIDEVSNAIEATGLNDPSWYNRNRPVFILLVIALSYYDKARKKRQKEETLMLLSSIIYASRQYHYFQYNTGQGFENAMRYTVNNLSNKFLLKQKGSVWGAVEWTAEKSDDAYRRELTSGTDPDVFTYITNLYTRINQWIRNVARQFYDNKEKGKYLNLERETDKEDGGVLDTNNVSFVITKNAESSYVRAKTSKPNQRLCRLVAKSTGVSVSAVYNALEAIFSDEDERLKELIRLILTIFLIDQSQSPENINSAKFNAVSLRTYAKSHTTEENVVALKSLLGNIMEDHSEEYVKTQRVATKTSFKKAVFLYMVTHIQQSVKG